jgi:hypothetical protein
MGYMTYNLLEDTWLLVRNTGHEYFALPLKHLFGHTEVDEIEDSSIEEFIRGKLHADRDAWDIQKGWGCRLGAVDGSEHTEWTGPFLSAENAARALIGTYGDGDPMDDWEKELRRDYDLGGVIDVDDPIEVLDWMIDHLLQSLDTTPRQYLSNENITTEEWDQMYDTLLDLVKTLKEMKQESEYDDPATDPISAL